MLLSVRSLTSVLASLEMVVEFLVVSLKTNLACVKDMNTLVLSFSHRQTLSLVPRNSTTNISLAPGDFLATKYSVGRHRLRGRVGPFSGIDRTLPHGGFLPLQPSPAPCRATQRGAAPRFTQQHVGTPGGFGKSMSPASHPDFLEAASLA